MKLVSGWMIALSAAYHKLPCGLDSDPSDGPKDDDDDEDEDDDDAGDIPSTHPLPRMRWGARGVRARQRKYLYTMPKMHEQDGSQDEGRDVR